MDFPIAQAPVNYPNFFGVEPFPTQPSNDAHVLGQNCARHCPMRGYGFLEDWTLPDCDHPTEGEGEVQSYGQVWGQRQSKSRIEP